MQRKLFATYFVLIVFTISVSVYVTWSISYDFLMNQYEQQFISEGMLLSELLKSKDLDERDEIQNFVNGYSQSMKARITLIDEKGVVVADSENDPKLMENHAYREEVQEALNGHIATSIRYSSTMGKHYSYTAIPLKSEYITGVLRLSLPLDDIEYLSFEMIKYILSALVVSTLIAIFIAFIFTNMFMKPINDLTKAAEDISNGDYEKKIYIKQKDQIGKLAEAFNDMSVKLKINMWKLTQRKMQLEAILSSMIHGIVAVDETYKIVFHNKLFNEMLDIQQEEIVGKSIYDFVRNTVLFNVLEKSTESNEYIVAEGKLTINDEERIIRIYANPIRVKQVKELGTLLVIQDMTQIRKLENIRRDFVSNVTHELKTPLTSIRGFVDTLKNGAIEDEDVARRFLDIIDIETERLYLLIQDILSLSEIESKQNEKNIKNYDIKDIVYEVLELLRPKVKESAIELKVEVENEIPKFKCNRDRIKQLLINLIDNAIKYTEEGSVTIRCKTYFDHLIMEVEDTGIGIDKEHIPRLFERFYRVDKGRSRKQGGTGLGLSIVKHIVELYEGIIKVESQIGVGTKFIIKLPFKH
jgi:two-component system phosphate regulon sensor histidine kinase PhoR